jgi:hypothetical protein
VRRRHDGIGRNPMTFEKPWRGLFRHVCDKGERAFDISGADAVARNQSHSIVVRPSDKHTPPTTLHKQLLVINH